MFEILSIASTNTDQKLLRIQLLLIALERVTSFFFYDTNFPYLHPSFYVYNTNSTPHREHTYRHVVFSFFLTQLRVCFFLLLLLFKYMELSRTLLCFFYSCAKGVLCIAKDQHNGATSSRTLDSFNSIQTQAFLFMYVEYRYTLCSLFSSYIRTTHVQVCVTAMPGM